MQDAQTTLLAENLGHRFGRRILFRSLNFQVDGGEVVAVTGANGSGKSTLMRVLAGVLAPSRGTVLLRVHGENVADEDRPFVSGLVAPYLNVYDGFSPRENLQFIGRARRLQGTKGRIDEVLELVQLADRADDHVGTFSSGMKQRVRFASALLADPPLVLLDEPTSNLDEAGVATVRGLVESCRNSGRIVLIATNDPAEAAACDREVCVTELPRVDR